MIQKVEKVCKNGPTKDSSEERTRKRHQGLTFWDELQKEAQNQAQSQGRFRKPNYDTVKLSHK